MTATVRPVVEELVLRSATRSTTHRRRHLFYVPAVRRFVGCQVLGQTADAATTLTLATVLVATLEPGSAPGALAAALLAAAVPFACSPLAGIAADRWDRRRMLCTVNLVRAAVVCLALLVPITGSRPLGFALLAALLGISRLVYTLRAASLTHLVAPDRLVALDSLALLAAMASGAAGAGAAVVIGGPAPVVLLALAATAHAVAALGFGGVPVGLGGGLHLGEISHPPLREVVAHVGRLLGARPCGLAMTLTGGHRALLGATFATVVIVADTRFDLGASGYAATVALLSTGALIGTLTAPVVARRWQRGRVSVVALVTAGVAGVLMALALDHPAVVAAAVVAMAFAFQNLRVVADATVQSEVDDDALGRVFAVYDAVYNLAFVAGALVAIGLVGRVTAAQMLLAVGVTYVVASVMHSLDSKRCPW